jgi:Domain of unknown function (DUF6285)
MQNRPTAAELADAVRSFLEDEIGPALVDPRLKFRTLVAANALGILGRDLALGPELLREEVEVLSKLLSMKGDAPALNAELCRRIRGGEPPHGTLRALRRIAELKLRIASPRYLEAEP